MSEKIVQLNEEVIKGQIKELIRGSVEETVNELLEQEAEKSRRHPGMSEMRLARATAAATMTEILPRLPAMSRSMFPDSRASHLRLLSLSDIAAGKAAWKRR